MYQNTLAALLIQSNAITVTVAYERLLYKKITETYRPVAAFIYTSPVASPGFDSLPVELFSQGTMVARLREGLILDTSDVTAFPIRVFFDQMLLKGRNCLGRESSCRQYSLDGIPASSGSIRTNSLNFSDPFCVAWQPVGEGGEAV